METALILTIGTRDLQLVSAYKKYITDDELDKTFPSNDNKYEILSNVRKQGQLINNEYKKYSTYIEFPIIKPALDYILSGSDKIDKLVIYTTNQTNAEEFHKSKDTLYIGKILEKYIKEKYNEQFKHIIHEQINENVTYYDEMYDLITDLFSKKNYSFDKHKVYILAQGGIDAINTAILLKSIELFPNLTQLHKPENKGIDILSFPDKFKININKNLIKNAINNYNYYLIIENFKEFNKSITQLCSYAHYRLNLDYKVAFNSCETLMKLGSLNKDYIINILQNRVSIIEEKKLINSKQKDLYISAKIKLKQLHFGDFLMKIFTLSENILKPRVTDLGFDITYEEGKHTNWKNSFKQIDKKENNKLSEHLKNSKLKKGGLFYESPNKFAFYGIVEYFSEKENNKDNFLEICKSIFILADLRNIVAHQLDTVDYEKINRQLQNRTNQSLSDFTDKLDALFNVIDFDVYDQINKKIISLL